MGGSVIVIADISAPRLLPLLTHSGLYDAPRTALARDPLSRVSGVRFTSASLGPVSLL
jgi:hypothetical protein